MYQMMIKALVIMLIPFFCQTFEIQAHRGSRGAFPENTLPAFAAAVRSGCGGIEMDLLMTKDEEIVIHHDFFLNPLLCRYADGSCIQQPALISSLKLSELKELDCGLVQHPNFPDQHTWPGAHIPTLQEVFHFLSSFNHLQAKNIRLNLELKADPETPHYIPSYAAITNKIMQIANENKIENPLYYSSFDFQLLFELRKLDNQVELGLIFDHLTLAFQGIDPNDWVQSILNIALQLQATIISPDCIMVNSKNVQELQEAGLRIIPWTINDPHYCLELFHLGMDGIITDYPEQMLSLTSHLKRPSRKYALKTNELAY